MPSTVEKRAKKMFTGDFAQNVHDYFAWMREHEPICKAQFMRWQNAYVVTRYDDVIAAMKDKRIVKSLDGNGSGGGGQGSSMTPKAIRPLLNNILLKDGADHRRLRKLAQMAFSPRIISNLEPHIQSIADDLFTKAQAESEVDLVKSFALPLPKSVIAALIGIPSEDRPRFFDWTRRIIVTPSPLNIMMAIPPLLSLLKYLRQLVEKRKADPQDDMITALLEAEDEDGDRLQDDETLAMVCAIIFGAFESTAALIANGTLALLSHPGQLELLRQDPSKIELAVEEFLRYDGPLQTAEKSFASEPLSIRGVDIPQGAVILSALLSANRDETAFDRPNELDVTRSPNRHVAFGHGIHFCIGAPLARLEARIAFATLLNRSPNLRLLRKRDDLRYRNIIKLHQLEELPVGL